MIKSLSIKNYALIDQLEVDFHSGFSIITGETGAGKSILLGGLALILGKRADLSSLKNKEKKCIIEGEFSIGEYNLTDFFTANDLDFELNTTLRREILPNGKSRAFINDTPANLSVMSSLGDALIDIHSQHQTLQLAAAQFQFKIIDALADTTKEIDAYRILLTSYKSTVKTLESLRIQHQKAKEQYEYHAFLFNELNEANFSIGEQEKLENSLESLNHLEEVKSLLDQVQKLNDMEDFGLMDSLNKFESILQKLSNINSEFESLSQRITSAKIEIEDLSNELHNNFDKVDHSPEDIENYNDRLQLLYSLYKKHGVNTIDELLKISTELASKVELVEQGNSSIDEAVNKIKLNKEGLDALAKSIHAKRAEAIPRFTSKLETQLARLEMPHTRFKINLALGETYHENGKDELEFNVSTNKGAHFESLKKVASGGEMSRIMLAVKYILSQYSKLPTIIFDEIDTGVSGEVSNKIADIMADMSNHMQVLAITHLPQIAARGTNHYKVFKTVNELETQTNISLLSSNERINEVAEMLSGKKLIDSAVTHAKQLLNQ